MDKKIETITVAEAAKRLRELGMSITPETIRLWLLNKVYTFGECVLSKNGNPVCHVYTKLFDQWINERM